MPRRTARGMLVIRALLALAAVFFLVALLAGAGLEAADKLGSSVAAVLALAALAVTFVLPGSSTDRPGSSPDRPGSSPDRAGVAPPAGDAGAAGGSAALEIPDAAGAGPRAPGAVTETVCVGTLPPIASAFQPRIGLRDRIRRARDSGTDVVLGQDIATDPAARILAGGGGTGKSQLAAWFARQAIRAKHTDLVVWVPASGSDQILTAYARAARRMSVPGASGIDESADATAFLEWLQTCDRTWLIVLDDIADPSHVSGWWPPARSHGWTLATTRLQDATLLSGGRQKIDIDVYEPAESISYLTTRLAEAGRGHCLDDAVPELAEALGHLPLALSHAAAYLINQAIPCRRYLSRYQDGQEHLTALMPAGSRPDEYHRPIAVALLLTLEAAGADDPAGLARPALTLAALLDPAGHPAEVWATDAVAAYLSDAAGQRVTSARAWEVLRVLHRYGLVSHTPEDGPRAVRIHALTARAAREAAGDLVVPAWAAAEALLEIWPDIDYSINEFNTVLRANAMTLHDVSGEALWHPVPHRLIPAVGVGLSRSGLYQPAIEYHRRIIPKAEDLLGDKHPGTIGLRRVLAISYRQARRTEEAISLQERVVEDSGVVLGENHRDTIAARANLAICYRQAGRVRDSIALHERVLGTAEDVLGDRHPATIRIRVNLANSYCADGRAADAIALQERALHDYEHLLGERHPDTILTRVNLASSYRDDGRTADAIALQERALDDSRNVLGDQHPETIRASACLAACYREAGRTADAVALLERAVADFTRVIGPQHPDTVWAAGLLTDLTDPRRARGSGRGAPPSTPPPPHRRT